MKTGKLLLLLTSLLFSSLGSAFAAEDAIDLFIRTNSGGWLVSWDLLERSPQTKEELAPGMGMLLDANSGAWLDSRTLDATDFLRQRLDLWSRRAPRLTARLRLETERALPLLATSLYIQRMPDRRLRLMAPNYGGIPEPGAFTDGETGVTFLDLSVWNRVGVRSQAAMLLHAHLRNLAVADEAAKDLIHALILLEPSAPVTVDDSLAATAAPVVARALPANPLEDAVRRGILGARPVYNEPLPIHDPDCIPSPTHWCPVGGSDAGHSGGGGTQ